MTIHKWEPFKNEPWYLRCMSTGWRTGKWSGLLCHMRGIELRKDLNLLLDILYLIFCTFEVNNLDCYSLPSPFVEAEGV